MAGAAAGDAATADAVEAAVRREGVVEGNGAAGTACQPAADTILMHCHLTE
jgi:hypothetical protein